MAAASPAEMFDIVASDGAARTGTLKLPNGTIETPGFLMNTRRGAPMHLTVDIIEDMTPAVPGMQLNSLQFLKHPDPSVLRRFGQGGHKYLGLEGFPLIAGVRDPTLSEYGFKPSTDKGVYVTIHSGGYTVTPSQHAEIIEVLRPDAFLTLADEVSTSASAKRVTTSVTRTAKWLEEGIEECSSRGIEAAVWAPVVGGGLEAQRRRSAELAAAHDDNVAGYSLAGFGTGEQQEARRPLLRAAVAQLPANKVRHVPAMGSFSDVVDAVGEGGDLFDSSFLHAIIVQGHALTFNIPLSDGNEGTGAEGVVDGDTSDRIDLWSTEYRLDKRPLLPGCKCYACTNHTRAYMHHLLMCGEMLAPILLDIHNTHHALLFFAEMRRSIASGKFQQFKAASQAVLQEADVDGLVLAERVVASAAKASKNNRSDDQEEKDE